MLISPFTMASTASQQVNLLQKILESHRDVWSKHLKGCQPLITQTERPPSFVQFLGSEFQDGYVILSSNFTTTELVKSSDLEKQEDEGEVVIPVGLDIEGTPLEAPFTQEEMDLLTSKLTTLNLNFFPLDKFGPLPSLVARNVLVWYALALNEFSKNKVSNSKFAPLLITCNAEKVNPGKMMQHPCLLGVGSHKSMSDTTISAYYLGQMCQEEMTKARTQFFDNLVTNKNKIMSDGKITSSILRAEYLQQTLQLENDSGQENSKADCFLVKILWTNPRNPNSDIPLTESARATSSIEITLQDNFSLWETGKIWEELKLLQELLNLYSMENEDTDQYLCAVSGDNLPQSIEELLNSNNFDSFEEYDLNSLEDLIKFINDGKKPCSDLTDAIWNKFKYTGNVCEISKGIENVLKQCVSNDFNIQPTNKTELGQLGLELFHTKDATLIEAPSFKKTIYYMLEIGFLKLQRDFSYLAMSSQLMVSTCMTKALDNIDWTHKVDMISRIHKAFEIVMRAKKWLHLEADALNQLFVQSLEVPLAQKIVVDVPSIQLGHIIKCYQPVIRSWKFEVAKGALTTSHNFLASLYPIFSWTDNKRDHDDTMDISMISKSQKATFYCAVLSENKRNLKE